MVRKKRSLLAVLAPLQLQLHTLAQRLQHLERVFGRFECAVSVRQYGGLGRGLYIARQVVEALGGSIQASSTFGEGTTFTVTLPLSGPQRR